MSKKAAPARAVRRYSLSKVPRVRRRRAARALTAAQFAAGLRSVLKPRYWVECYYRGFDMALDRKVRKLVGRDADSGMALWLGLRDLSFRFASPAAASAAAKRVKAAKLRGVHVMIRSLRRA